MPPERSGTGPSRALSPAELGQRRANARALSTHGARSEARIRPAARTQKARLLRQIGLAASDLDGVGRALLDNWARAQAKVELLDRYFAARGFLGEAGDPQPATKLYFVAVNSARLAIVRLSDHLRERYGSELERYIEARYSEVDGDG
jgi:hypothetical protein